MLTFDASVSSKLNAAAVGPYKRILNLAAGIVPVSADDRIIDNHEHPSLGERYKGIYQLLFDLYDEKWPIEDGTYDIVTAWHVIEHLPLYEVSHFLKECHRVLRASGVLIMETPEAKAAFGEYIAGNMGMITCVFGRDDRFGNQHRFLYDRAGLSTLLLVHGWMHVVTSEAKCYHKDQIPSFRIEAVKI